MGFTTSNAFVGKNRSKILTNLVLGADTIDKGMIQIIQNVFDDTYLNRVALADDPLIAPEVTPTTSVTAAKTEVAITPGEAMLYLTFNPNTFQNDWESYWPKGPRVENEIPSELMNPLLEVISKKTNKQIEKMMWQGNTAGAAGVNRWDGFLKLIDADGTVVDVSSPVALTAANIVGELERTLAAVPDEVYGDPNLKIAVSYANVRMYEQAARALGFKGTNIDGRIVHQFGGVPIVPLAGMPQGRMIAGRFGSDENSNFYAQTWMADDYRNFKVDRLQANSELWFVLAKFQFGVQYGFGAEIVNYAGS
jgi:hypothetical protein